MNRRDLLKAGGLCTAGLAVYFISGGKVPSMPIQVEAQGKLYRGVSDGKILVSTDAGESWQQQMNFGSSLSILALDTDAQGQVLALLGIKGHSFALTLAPDGKTWKTI